MALHTLHITKENFEQEVLNSDVPVLVDFWATWCAPCRMAAPIVDQLAEELSGTAKVGKINIEEQQELATSFKVMSIPTFAVFRQGKVVAFESGLRSKDHLKELVER